MVHAHQAPEPGVEIGFDRIERNKVKEFSCET
jgi:hypothetical protein